MPVGVYPGVAPKRSLLEEEHHRLLGPGMAGLLLFTQSDCEGEYTSLTVTSTAGPQATVARKRRSNIGGNHKQAKKISWETEKGAEERENKKGNI